MRYFTGLFEKQACSILILRISLTLTSNDRKETEHDRIEEAKAHGQGVLVDDSRDDEHREHGSCSEFPFRQLQGSEGEQRGWASKFRGQLGGESVSVDLQDCHGIHALEIQAEPSGTLHYCSTTYL